MKAAFCWRTNPKLQRAGEELAKALDLGRELHYA